MIPKEAIEAYARLGGDFDMAQYAKLDTQHWDEIDSLLMRLQIVDGAYAADSYRADFLQEVEKAGVSLETLRGLKKLIDRVDAEKRKKA